MLRLLAGELPPPGTRLGAGAIDAPLRASAAGEPAWRPPAGWPEPRGGEVDSVPGGGLAPELALWRAVHDASFDLRPVLTRSDVGASDGPLIAQGRYRTLETWTESELSALHALGRVVGSGRHEWAERLDRARSWHLEHTQPDNATNRPWALHVFVQGGDLESALYAQTLLHNAQVAGPTLEPLARVIMLDAANELERGAR